MILQEVFLIDSEYVKMYSTISDNMEEKYINPCIVTAQVQELQQLIGTPLATKLCQLMDDETIHTPENAVYSDLLVDYVQPFLLACTQSEILVSNMAKLRNSGNMQYVDTNQQNINIKDMQYLHQHYCEQSTFLANRISDFIRCHISEIPEAKYCPCCKGLGANPNSAIKVGFVL